MDVYDLENYDHKVNGAYLVIHILESIPSMNSFAFAENLASQRSTCKLVKFLVQTDRVFFREKNFILFLINSNIVKMFYEYKCRCILTQE